MQQSYWYLTGNLWALALSTVIALFRPEFGPEQRMNDGVGVVIRATMAVPVVFSAMYFAGRLMSYLAGRWRLMSILMAGIEHGIQKEAEKRAKAAEQEAEQRAEAAAQQRIEAAVQQAREREREQVRRFMRVQGLSEEQINAFFRQLSSED